MNLRWLLAGLALLPPLGACSSKSQFEGSGVSAAHLATATNSSSTNASAIDASAVNASSSAMTALPWQDPAQGPAVVNPAIAGSASGQGTSVRQPDSTDLGV